MTGPARDGEVQALAGASSVAAVRTTLDARMPDHRAALEHLVRIAGVSAPGFDPAAVRRSVEATRDLLVLHHALHSGMYGGPVPDPVTGLAKVLAALTDDAGAVAIPGFADDARHPTAQERARLDALAFDTGTFRAEAGLLEGVALAGDPEASVLERLWLQPAATIIGLDAPAVEGSSNTLAPVARARVSVRLAPGQDPQRARDVLCRWLEASVPWGLHAEVTPGAAAGPFAVEPRAHGIDESLHLGDWRAACLAEAYLLAELPGARP